VIASERIARHLPDPDRERRAGLLPWIAPAMNAPPQAFGDNQREKDQQQGRVLPEEIGGFHRGFSGGLFACLDARCNAFDAGVV